MPTATQFLLATQAALIAVNTGIVALEPLDVTYRSMIVFASTVMLAFIGPLLPKASGTLRRVLELRRG